MAEQPAIAVVLLSGGMDSCVTAALARAAGKRLALLHSSYGQRTEARERSAFREIARRLKAEFTLEIDQHYLGQIGGSALTDPRIAVPDADLAAADAGRIPVTYVPFRNAHFLSAAVSWAEALGAPEIHIGAVEQDSSGYPDCRPAYYRVFNDLIEVGTRPETHVEIVAPLIGWSKAQIVRKGLALDAPLDLTWSCYEQSAQACGRCDSCVLRLRAFEEAGARDPLPYAVRAVS